MNRDNQEQTLTSATTGGIETIRLLGEAVKKHRGRPEGWRRFGALLAARRTQLGYPHGKREQFVRERSRPGGLTSKDAYEMERGLLTGGRKAWPTGKLIAAAELYAVTLESVIAALDGGDLEPAPPPARPVPVAVPDLPAAGPPPAVLMSGVLSARAIAAAAPYATAILGRLRDLAAEPVGVIQPSGYDVFQRDLTAEGIKDVFPGGGRASRKAASRWDRNLGDMPEDDLVWLIAARHAVEAADAQPDRNVS